MSSYKNQYNSNNSYRDYKNQYNSNNNSGDYKNQNGKNKKEENDSKKAKTGFSFLDNFLHQDDRNDDEKYFEILGLKLYNDDILLLCLLFFLYKEEVKDPYLFIALILLLLS